MAADLERLAREFGNAGHPEMELYLNAGAKIARRLGAPVSFLGNETARQAETIKVYPEISLEEEWQRQAGRFIKLGFNRELDLSAKKYLASLPKFEPQPESFSGRFDIPVLVETRIAPSRQADMAGLPYYFGGLNIRDWESDPSGYRTSISPYTVWMQDGKKNLGRSVKGVRKTLKPDERGATEYDGVALLIANPTVLKDHYIDLPGASVGSGRAAVSASVVWPAWGELPLGWRCFFGVRFRVLRESCRLIL